jgi:hypothetical protein
MIKKGEGSSFCGFETFVWCVVLSACRLNGHKTSLLAFENRGETGTQKAN